MSSDQYTLHLFPFSLYSLFSRFAYVLGRSSLKDEPDRLALALKLVNLHRHENLSEHFLRLNPKGQVPVLTGGSLAEPVVGSLNVSLYLCKYYPRLLPAAHEAVIRETLSQLHAFHARPLSVPAQDVGKAYPCAADALLSRHDIGEGHRRLLELKKVFHDTHMKEITSMENFHKTETMVRELGVTLLGIYKDDGSPWLFGEAVGPTVLDAHVTALYARLVDNQRGDLIPEKLQKYTEQMRAGPEWRGILRGRSTIWNSSVGDVDKLDEW